MSSVGEEKRAPSEDCLDNCDEFELIDAVEAQLNDVKTELNTKNTKLDELSVEILQLKKELNESKKLTAVWMFFEKHAKEELNKMKVQFDELGLEMVHLQEKLKETESTSVGLESELIQVRAELKTTKENHDELSLQNDHLTEQIKERDVGENSKGQMEEKGMELAHSSDVDVVGSEVAVASEEADENEECKLDDNFKEGRPTIAILNGILRQQDEYIADLVNQKRKLLETIGILKVQ